MSAASTVSGSSDAPRVRPRVVLAALLVATIAGFAASLLGGRWFLAPDGSWRDTDFLGVWAAGRLVLEGRAASAYDWAVHGAVEDAALGRTFGGYYGWHYPPPPLFFAAALALLPYGAALLAWMALTLPLALLTVRRIAGTDWAPAGFLLFPAVQWNVFAGQNGFLTAALLGSGLLLLEKRPWLAGILLGLLTYKPQFGLLVPVALLAGGHWRVTAGAAATALALALLAAVALGPDVWPAFAASLADTSRSVMAEGRADLRKLQSVFGQVRAAGGSTALAWTAQAAVTGALAVGIALLFRSAVAPALKAAGLGVASLLASPYLYFYDLVLLAVPVAFLARAGLHRAEMAVLALAALALALRPPLNNPLGLLSAAAVGLIVARRLVASAETPVQA